MKYLSLIKIGVLFLFVLAFCSCEKDAGEGGNSSIYGNVKVRHYNSSMSFIYPKDTIGYDEDVYIIYGNNKSFGDRTRTSYDGTYEFKYLRPGKYTVYVYSRDSTDQTSVQLKKAITKEVEITENNQDVDAGISVILKIDKP